MSLPRFISRVADAIGPLMASPGSADELREFLSSKAIRLETSAEVERSSFHSAGLLLLVNLCARLYPELHIAAPAGLADECASVARRINPECTIVVEAESSGKTSNHSYAGVVSWATSRSRENAIVVAPVGWDVVLDEPAAMQVRDTNMLTSLAAASIAASELFRMVFADRIVSGRHTPIPARFNLLTNQSTSLPASLPDLPSDIALGRVHLVGAGAIGQAVVYALARVSATGQVIVVDPENVTESNLQRYVLSLDEDVGRSKCEIVERALAKSRLEVVPVGAPWSLDIEEVKNAQVVCVAVDTASLRIEIQAALPARLYNAWTQPGDLGWSRHEQFSVQPCLACLYWPTRPKPSYHELIAAAIKQHELRVLAYLVHKLAVDVPLRNVQIPRIVGVALPADSGEWTERSLLADMARDLEIPEVEHDRWRGRLLPDLYSEGVCGGALVSARVADVPTEMAVPLAHQSVLAGIMLATQLVVAARPELTMHRSETIESRLNLLSGFPQVAQRPRQPTPNCLCSDPDLGRRFIVKWPHLLAEVAAP